jgi:hypothetical protein
MGEILDLTLRKFRMFNFNHFNNESGNFLSIMLEDISDIHFNLGDSILIIFFKNRLNKTKRFKSPYFVKNNNQDVIYAEYVGVEKAIYKKKNEMYQLLFKRILQKEVDDFESRKIKIAKVISVKK